MTNPTINLATQRFFISDNKIRETLDVNKPTLLCWTQKLDLSKREKT